MRKETLFLCFWLLCKQAFAILPIVTVQINTTTSRRDWFKSSVEHVLDTHGFRYSFEPIFAYHNESMFSNMTTEQWELVAAAVEKQYPDQASSLHGVSDAFTSHSSGSYVSFQYLAGWVYFHELAHTDLATPELQQRMAKSCTGILLDASHFKADGIYHARNMDNEPSNFLRNVTLRHQWVGKGNEVLYESIDWYWFTSGFVTGFKKGAMSIEENWRFCDPISATTVFQKIQAAAVTPQVYFFPQLLDSLVQDPTLSFETMVKTMLSTPTAAPMYVIVASVSDGAVLSLDPDEQLPVYRLNSKSDTNTTWYVVQTNYDQWKPDPSNDARRTAATNMVTSFAKADYYTSAENIEMLLMSILGTAPVGNEDTTYSVMMNAKTGLLLPVIHDVQTVTV